MVIILRLLPMLLLLSIAIGLRAIHDAPCLRAFVLCSCDEDLRRGRSRRRGRVRYRSSSTRDITKWAKMARDRARAQEIDIYTVFYGRDRGASRWLRDNVATDQDLHFEALERWQIDDAFVDICVQFTGGSAGMLF